MTMRPIRFGLFASSVRPGRMNERVLKLVEARLNSKGHEVQIIDPLTIQMPMLIMPLHFHPNRSEAPKELIELNKMVENMDAIILTAAEYNRCIPPALSNILNYLPHASFAFKSVGIITYSIGNVGGVLCGSQLRLLLAELGSVTVPHSAAIGFVGKDIDENGHTTKQSVIQEIDLVIDQVSFLTQAKQLIEEKNIPLPKIHPYL